MNVKQLREFLVNYNDNDIVVVEIHEGSRHEDLYEFEMDVIDYVKLPDGTFGNEIRICI